MQQESRISFHDQISSNKWKSFFLILIVVIVLLALGAVIGLALGPDYFILVMFFTVIFTLIYVLVGYYQSHKITIASVGGKEAKFEEYRQYHHVVEGLCLASGLPKPKLYIMEDDDINAFASGRDPQHAVICVTTAALEKLDKQELEGVLAHELSHVGNYDIRYMTLAAVLVGMIAMISHIFLRSLFWGAGSRRDNGKGNAQVIFIIIGIALAILAPIFATLVQLAISRKREYAADASAVKFIRSPTGLIRALEKLKNNPSTPHGKITRAVAPLFISDPFDHNKKSDSWLSTHPTLDNRIAILKRM
ncbi:MAG: M48 family metallopeptidase [Nanoarchaeota archaeon]|nr:M48 family metallopeptidase [Nanoarchaeota archaeon]